MIADATWLQNPPPRALPPSPGSATSEDPESPTDLRVAPNRRVVPRGAHGPAEARLFDGPSIAISHLLDGAEALDAVGRFDAARRVRRMVRDIETQRSPK